MAEQGNNGPDQAGDAGAEQGAKSPRSGKAPPAASRWKKGQSGNPKGRPKGRSLTDALRRRMRGEHNGKPMEEIVADVVIKHAMTGKFPYLKELFDRLEGKPTETINAKVVSRNTTFVVPPPRILNESEEEYTARINLENVARDHRRLIEGRGDEGAG